MFDAKLIQSFAQSLIHFLYTCYANLTRIWCKSNTNLKNLYAIFLFTNITQCVNESHAKPYNCWTNLQQIPNETPYESYKKLTHTFIRILYKSHTHIIQMLYKSRHNRYVTPKQTLHILNKYGTHLIQILHNSYKLFLRIWYKSPCKSHTDHYKSHQTRENLVQLFNTSYKKIMQGSIQILHKSYTQHTQI